MEDKPITITVDTKGLELRDFARLYAQAILSSYITYREAEKSLRKQLAADVDKPIIEIKVHLDGEVHIYFRDGDKLEYTVEDLGLTDKF